MMKVPITLLKTAFSFCAFFLLSACNSALPQESALPSQIFLPPLQSPSPRLPDYLFPLGSDLTDGQCSRTDLLQSFGWEDKDNGMPFPNIKAIFPCNDQVIGYEEKSAYADREWRIKERKSGKIFDLVIWNGGSFCKNFATKEDCETLTVEDCGKTEKCEYFGTISLYQQKLPQSADILIAEIDKRSFQHPPLLSLTNDDLFAISKNLESGKLFFHENGKQKTSVGIQKYGTKNFVPYETHS
ncbi:MAG: hypothetical protein WCJ84_05730 [Candidatus Peregrinibacteria bacterium]